MVLFSITKNEMSRLNLHLYHIFNQILFTTGFNKFIIQKFINCNLHKFLCKNIQYWRKPIYESLCFFLFISFSGIIFLFLFNNIKDPTSKQLNHVSIILDHLFLDHPG